MDPENWTSPSFKTGRNQEFRKDDSHKERNDSAKKRNEYKVVLEYDPIISCNKKELCSELHTSWDNIGKLWGMKYEKVWNDYKQPSQLNGFQGFLSNKKLGIKYINVCHFLFQLF